MPPRARANDANSTRKACPIPNAAYTPKYPPLQRKDTASYFYANQQNTIDTLTILAESQDILLGS